MVKNLKTDNTKNSEEYRETKIGKSANWYPHFGKLIKSIHKVEHIFTPWSSNSTWEKKKENMSKNAHSSTICNSITGNSPNVYKQWNG